MEKRPRGFAAISKERQRELARLGGIASHAKGTGHEWDHFEAKKAGAKGGKVSKGGRGKNWVPTEKNLKKKS